MYSFNSCVVDEQVYFLRSTIALVKNVNAGLFIRSFTEIKLESGPLCVCTEQKQAQDAEHAKANFFFSNSNCIILTETVNEPYC